MSMMPGRPGTRRFHTWSKTSEPEDLMVSLSNHEVGNAERYCHALVLRQAQDEVYWQFRSAV